MRKNILFVNWGTRDKIFPFKVARRKKLDVYLATSRNYPAWVKDFVPKKRMIFTNTYDSEKLIIDVLLFILKNKVSFDAITTFFEMNIVQTADLAFTLGCKFISPKAARRSSGNKLLMRLRCQEKGIPTPRFTVFSDLGEGFKALRKISVPAVIKPVKSGHSFGAVLVDKLDKNEFVKLFKKARKQLDSNADEWMAYYSLYKEDFLLEEYLGGPVLSVDGLVQNGKVMICGITKFIMSPPPSLIQEGVYIPANFSPETKRLCFAQAKKIIKALEFNNCGFHCEMVLTHKKGPILLEIAARPPGGDMLAGYQDAFGIDFAGLYLDICLGKKVDFRLPKAKKFVVQRAVVAKQKGIVKKVEGVEKVKKLKSLTHLYHGQKGDFVDFFTQIPDSLVYYILTCDGRKQLEEDEKFILEAVKFSYYPRPYFCLKKLAREAKRALKRSFGWEENV